MKPKIKTIYLPADGKDCDYIVKWYDDSYENDVKKEEGYFFTPEEFNKFVSDLIKDTLETAAENADLIETDGDVDPNSITNQFENIFEKYKV